jgi:hypothetical protein
MRVSDVVAAAARRSTGRMTTKRMSLNLMALLGVVVALAAAAQPAQAARVTVELRNETNLGFERTLRAQGGEGEWVAGVPGQTSIPAGRPGTTWHVGTFDTWLRWPWEDPAQYRAAYQASLPDGRRANVVMRYRADELRPRACEVREGSESGPVMSDFSCEVETPYVVDRYIVRQR